MLSFPLFICIQTVFATISKNTFLIYILKIGFKIDLILILVDSIKKVPDVIFFKYSIDMCVTGNSFQR